MRKSPLTKLADASDPQARRGIIKLLLADHRYLRSLMAKVRSKRSSARARILAFRELEKAALMHASVEEQTFLRLIKDHPRFEDQVLEGYEEHRVHETVLAGIRRLRSQTRKLEQMKIFCEIIEHHLDEEESDLFPRFQRYAATSTSRKIGSKYLKARQRKAPTARVAGRGAGRFGKRRQPMSRSGTSPHQI